MKTPVVIKGARGGLTIVLDNEMNFDELKGHIAEKFSSSSEFLGSADIAIAFEGRTLNIEEIDDVLSIIKEKTKLNVIYVLDDDNEKIDMFNKVLADYYTALETANEQPMKEENKIFHKGNLRSGQSISSESDIIILGDVNAGANVIARGNIIIIGTLLGTVHAGCDGNYNAFVISLDMRPTQIRIGELIARSADRKVSKLLPAKKKPEIAYSLDGNIYIEEITREVINDIQI